MDEETKNPSSDDTSLVDELSPEEGQDHRLERYAKAKRRSRVIADYIMNQRLDLHPIGQVVKQCGEFLIYRHFFQSGIYQMIGGCTCKKHLLCLLCAIRRAAKQLKAYLEKVELILTDVPTLKLGLITLTVKNGDDLSERYEHLKRALQRLTNRRRHIENGYGAVQTVMTSVKGAVWTFEATKKNRGWHPHVHMLAMFKSDVDLGEMVEEVPGSWRKERVGSFEQALTAEWKQITGDSFIVDVRPISEGRDRLGAFCEVFKYALKTNGMDPKDQVEAFAKLRGRRLISSLGMLFGVKVPDESMDTVEDQVKLEPYVDLLYRYSENLGYQLEKQIEPEVIMKRLVDRKLRLARRSLHERKIREYLEMTASPEVSA